MKNSIYHFFLLILKVLFNLTINAICKYNRFFKTLMKKNLEFNLRKKVGSISLFLYFILLPLKVNLVLEKQRYKKDIFSII